MFTGIVKLETQIQQCLDTDYGKRLTFVLPVDATQNLQIGASVAINGACLTVVSITPDENNLSVELGFDVIFETLTLTNLADLKTGSWVNVERAAKFGDEIGGHHLSGHIHAQVQVEKIVTDKGVHSILLSVPNEWQKYIMHKGYIGLNGCSLTIGAVNDGQFWVHLIPETLAITNFDKFELGTQVNLEIDTQTQTIVDTVERLFLTASTRESLLANLTLG